MRGIGECRNKEQENTPRKYRRQRQKKTEKGQDEGVQE